MFRLNLGKFSLFGFVLQVKGKFFFKIDPLGEGAKWRRTLGQELYSPLILAFAEQVKKLRSYSYLFSVLLGEKLFLLLPSQSNNKPLMGIEALGMMPSEVSSVEDDL